MDSLRLFDIFVFVFLETGEFCCLVFSQYIFALFDARRTKLFDPMEMKSDRFDRLYVDIKYFN